MGERLWRWYRYAFIRTPLAAVSIIALMVSGMYVLMNGIEIHQYDSVMVTVYPNSNSSSGSGVIYLTAHIGTGTTELREDDEVTWYVRASGDRYSAKVDAVQVDEQGTVVKIRVEAAEWNRAQAEASGEQNHYVMDIPTGKQTIMEQLLRKEVGHGE